MTRSIAPDGRRSDVTVLLVTDLPPAATRDMPQVQRRETVEPPVARHEALVALARAAFARGVRIAVPVDAEDSILLATIALEYTAPPVAERRSKPAPAPLMVMETVAPMPAARALLAPFLARDAVEYLNQDGLPIGLGSDRPDTPVEPTHGRRQPVTDQLVRATHPRVALFISPSGAAREDVQAIRSTGTPMALMGSSVIEPGIDNIFAEDEDVAAGVTSSLRRGRRSAASPDHEEVAMTPYPYLMQRLLAEWTAGGEGARNSR